MTTERTPAELPRNPAPPEIIEERLRGLMITIGTNSPESGRDGRHEDNSKLWYRLDRALEDLVYGLLQHDIDKAADTIVQEMHIVIDEAAVRLVIESKSAEWAGRRATVAA